MCFSLLKLNKNILESNNKGGNVKSQRQMWLEYDFQSEKTHLFAIKMSSVVCFFSFPSFCLSFSPLTSASTSFFFSTLSVFLDTCAALEFQPSPWKINAALQSLNPLGSTQPRHMTPAWSSWRPRRHWRGNDCSVCSCVSESSPSRWGEAENRNCSLAMRRCTPTCAWVLMQHMLLVIMFSACFMNMFGLGEWILHF